MGWLTIVELIIKFIPTLISAIMEIVKAIQGSKATFASKDDVNAEASALVCRGIDQAICELQKAKDQIASKQVGPA